MPPVFPWHAALSIRAEHAVGFPGSDAICADMMCSSTPAVRYSTSPVPINALHRVAFGGSSSLGNRDYPNFVAQLHTLLARCVRLARAVASYGPNTCYPAPGLTAYRGGTFTRKMTPASPGALELREPDPELFTNLTFHDLRHEAISRMADRTGWDPNRLSQFSGHRSLSSLKRYVHNSRQLLIDELRSIEER